MAINARVPHISGEVLRVGDPAIRVTQIAGETLRRYVIPDVRISHIAGEVLRAFPEEPPETGAQYGSFFLVFEQVNITRG